MIDEILFKLAGLPNLKGAPITVYLKQPRAQPELNIKTTEFVIDPKIPQPKILEPPKGYTNIKSFMQIMVPQSSIQDLF